jgi:hypothetical protein
VALLTVQTALGTGAEITFANVAASDTFQNTGNEILILKTGATAITFTIKAAVACNRGVMHDVVIALTANKEFVVDRLEPSIFTNPATGLCTIETSAQTNGQIAVIRV